MDKVINLFKELDSNITRKAVIITSKLLNLENLSNYT